MSEQIPESEGAPAPAETSAAPAESAPSAPSWAGPSQEEWQQTQQAVSYIASMFQEDEQPEQDYLAPNDEGQIDLDAYLDHAMNQRMAPVMPLLDASVKERGQREMDNIFKKAEQEFGDFDKELAERTAMSFLAAHPNDPVAATRAGAEYAASVRKNERGAGESSYKERLSRGPADYEPGASGSGVTTRAKPKSYDEVIANWSGETEA